MDRNSGNGDNLWKLIFDYDVGFRSVYLSIKSIVK